MSTEVEKSFVATLINGNDINLDFSTHELEFEQRPGWEADQNWRRVKKDSEYLCVNTFAANPVEFYFRYHDSLGGYRLWVRSGPYTGKLLSKSNNGYMYANYNYDRSNTFNLKLNGKIVTLDELKDDTVAVSIHVKTSGTHWQGYNRTTPDKFNTDYFWEYVSDGASDQYLFKLNIKQRGVDYADTDLFKG